MRSPSIGPYSTVLVAAALALLPACSSTTGSDGDVPSAFARATSPAQSAAIADYQRKLAAYEAAWRAHEAVAGPYWDAIAEKRKIRFAKRRNHEPVLLDDYVLTQPPLYSGPPRPVDPTAPEVDPGPAKPIPVMADFLAAAKQYFNFVPERPASDLAFKSAYARIAASAGITREQAVRVYAFETGGDGSYDVQSGLTSKRPNARAISTAVGYNQLVNTNTISILADKGDRFVRALQAKAATLSGAQRRALDAKIAILQRMIRFCRSVPRRWSAQQDLANTPQGQGVHAVLLDIDIGPYLQTQKLADSIAFARLKKYNAPLTAAELEMMNLTGDGNGIDMVMMPDQMRRVVPTANFFQRSGYERNPVAIRNNVVAELMAVTDRRMDSGQNAPGAQELASAF